jgi:hypothetical protein
MATVAALALTELGLKETVNVLAADAAIVRPAGVRADTVKSELSAPDTTGTPARVSVVSPRFLIVNVLTTDPALTTSAFPKSVPAPSAMLVLVS